MCLIILALLLIKISNRYFEYKELTNYTNVKAKYAEVVYKDLDSVNESIDSFIQIVYNDYKAINIDKYNDYINSKLENKIIEEVCKLVLDKVSNRYIEYLEFIYKNSEIAEIIYNRTMLIVILDIAQNNENYLVMPDDN